MRLTQCLSFSPAIWREEDGGWHSFCLATSVARSWTKQSKILGQSYCFIWRARKPDTQLKGWDCSRRVLAPWCHNASLATIGNLLVVRDSRQQVDHCGIPLTTVWDVPFELWTVSLFSSLRSHHRPDYFFLSPYPS